MKISIRFLLSIIFLLSSSIAQAEDKIVKFAFFKDYVPLSQGEDDKVEGYLIDILTKVFDNIDSYSASFHGDAWKRAQHLVKKGYADGLFTVRTDERKEYMYFADEPGMKAFPAMFYSKENPQVEQFRKISSIEDLLKFKLVNYRGNGWAKQLFKEENIDWKNDVETTIKFVKHSRGDILIDSYLPLKIKSEELGYGNDLEAKLLTFLPYPVFRVSIRKDFPEAEWLIKRINEELKKLRASGYIEALENDTAPSA